MDLMSEMALAADRTLNWNVLLAVKESEDLLNNTLAQHERAWSRGAAVVPLSYPAITQTNLNFRGGFADAMPGWAKTMALPDDEKMRALADPAERARLAAGARSPEAGIMSSTIAEWETLTVVRTFTPENKRFEGLVVLAESLRSSASTRSTASSALRCMIRCAPCSVCGSEATMTRTGISSVTCGAAV